MRARLRTSLLPYTTLFRSKDVELGLIASGTPGFVGADLENLVNEAALLAARQDKDVVTMGDFELAKDKVLMGPERDRKSTRLNSSHVKISYAVFCLKKKNI